MAAASSESTASRVVGVTGVGVVAMGGCDADSTYDEVLLLEWNTATQTVQKEYLPPLPRACAYGSAALIGEVTAEESGMVQMETGFGGNRVLDWLSSEQLPRIC